MVFNSEERTIMWTTLTTIVTVLVLINGAIMAGGLVLVAAGIAPAFQALAPGPYVLTHQVLDRYIDRYMPWNTRLTLLAGGALLLLRDGTAARGLVGAGLALTGLVALISETRNVPINRTVHAWDAAAPPAEAHVVLARWVRSNHWRTAAALLAMAAFAAAATIPR
jgi:hypothetical protein